MRGLFMLLAAMAVLACGAALSGTYHLTSINGIELPANWPFRSHGTITVTSGSLTLTSDSTFTSTVTTHEGDADPETENNSGTFTLDESNVIHFTPGPASDDDDPFEGTWDGDQITVTFDDIDDIEVTLVFRR